MTSLAVAKSAPVYSKRMVLGTVLTFAFIIAQSLGAMARGAPDSFADLADKLSPAVVNITTTTTREVRTSPDRPRLPEGSPFEDFFNEFFDNLPQDNNQGRTRKSSALGSGFVISPDGYIVTNNHVIESADEIVIEFFDGKELDATLIGRDANTDIALLKVEADEPLEFVPFGDSDIARVGDWVLAIGNPLGQGFSVSAGIISARNRSLQSGPYDDFIQTDAAINRGNSGGPLFNMDGEVIGVNTAIISPNGGSIGLGFSMSSRVVERVIDQLLEFGETRRGWLGVNIQDVDKDLAAALGLEKAGGALVSAVPEGPASEAGIVTGDVILSFDGIEVSDTRELVNVVGNTEVGKEVRVVIFRNGESETIKVTLGRREDAERIAAAPEVQEPSEPVQGSAYGMELSSLNVEIRQELSIDESLMGVVVTNIDDNSDAYDKGIRPGDVIVEIAQTPVSTPQQVTKAFDDAKAAEKRSVLLKVQRANGARFVGLALD